MASRSGRASRSPRRASRTCPRSHRRPARACCCVSTTHTRRWSRRPVCWYWPRRSTRRVRTSRSRARSCRSFTRPRACWRAAPRRRHSTPGIRGAHRHGEWRVRRGRHDIPVNAETSAARRAVSVPPSARPLSRVRGPDLRASFAGPDPLRATSADAGCPLWPFPGGRARPLRVGDDLASRVREGALRARAVAGVRRASGRCCSSSRRSAAGDAGRGLEAGLKPPL